MKTDKKNNSNKIKLVLLKKMGQTILNEELKKYIHSIQILIN